VRCLSARTAFDALLTTRNFPKGSHVMMSGESSPNAVFPLFNGLLLHIYPAINIPDMVPPGCGFTLSIWFKLCVCFRHTLSGKSALVAHVAQELGVALRRIDCFSFASDIPVIFFFDHSCTFCFTSSSLLPFSFSLLSSGRI
jgi:hypothetical protein